MAEEQDDWLDDPTDEEDGSAEELDQSDIDSLLAGDDSADPVGEDTPAAGENDSDTDQSDLDDLLAGNDSADPAGEEDGSDEELDQSNIDDLLAGADSADPTGEDTPAADKDDSEATVIAEPEDNNEEELGQSDIDDLLSGDSESSEDEDSSPDQEEIDRLFSEIDDDQKEPDAFQAEEVDFKDVLSEDSGEDDDDFLDTSNEFDDEEFDLDDDIPDIPDISEDDDDATVFEAREDTEDDQPDSGDVPLDETVLEDDKSGKSTSSGKFKLPLALPPYLQSRKNQGIVAGAVLLLIVLGVFIFSGGDENPQVANNTPAEKQTQKPIEDIQPPLVEAVNTPPDVRDLEYHLSNKKSSAIVLTAQDADGDKLSYELLSQPQYGKLDGQAPNLVYTPNSDFPGEDRFDFRVNDGKDFSPPVLANIIGSTSDKHPLSPSQKSRQKNARPRKLAVSANNFSYSVTGTKDLYIDWKDVWNKANYLPYSSQVSVEIMSDVQLGSLKKVNSKMHKYNARKYTSGKETIRYRFKLGKLRSKTKEIRVAVSTGTPAPEIRLHPVSQSYQPGEMVMLDASNSVDDERSSLLFSWQQLSGVPVKLEVLDKEGSRVSFMAPSSFNKSGESGPTIRLTAIDKSGKTDTLDIKISTKSRYKSALWGIPANNIF